eukprot:COSAG02_NODE_2367_length_9051_cov_10.810433_1_plen_92_part_00
MLVGMPSSRLAKVLLYLGALLAVVEMTATLLSVSRCVAPLLHPKGSCASGMCGSTSSSSCSGCELSFGFLCGSAIDDVSCDVCTQDLRGAR